MYQSGTWGWDHFYTTHLSVNRIQSRLFLEGQRVPPASQLFSNVRGSLGTILALCTAWCRCHKNIEASICFPPLVHQISNVQETTGKNYGNKYETNRSSNPKVFNQKKTCFIFKADSTLFFRQCHLMSVKFRSNMDINGHFTYMHCPKPWYSMINHPQDFDSCFYHSFETSFVVPDPFNSSWYPTHPHTSSRKFSHLPPEPPGSINLGRSIWRHPLHNSNHNAPVQYPPHQTSPQKLIGNFKEKAISGWNQTKRRQQSSNIIILTVNILSMFWYTWSRRYILI